MVVNKAQLHYPSVQNCAVVLSSMAADDAVDLWCEPEAEAWWDVLQSKSIPPPDGSGVGSNSGRNYVRRHGQEGATHCTIIHYVLCY